MKQPFKDSDTARMTHKEMVKQVADYLTVKGLTNVRAKVEPYPEPNPLKDENNGSQEYFPDITAYANQFLIVEVISAELIINKKKKRWEFFNGYTDRHNGVFIIAVPKSMKGVTKNRLLETGIHFNIWEI